MAVGKQGSYTYTPIIRRRKINKNTAPKQASSILGLWISQDGSSKEKTRRLQQITASWADKVRSGDITKKDALY